METQTLPPLAGHRGPADHDIRNQIILEADQLFSHYGYAKTTVSDLAKAIGFSKAYIYKFFESKQAIGEAICRNVLAKISEAVDEAAGGPGSATERVRRMVDVRVTNARELFFTDRKLYDIAAHAASERWQSTVDHEVRVEEALRLVIQEGRRDGEFERKTPLDETCRAILLALLPFTNPLLLQHNLDIAVEGARDVTGLILRSLAP